jgi:hypothetical protein
VPLISCLGLRGVLWPLAACWVACAVVWMHHYRIRPGEQPVEPPLPIDGDLSTWSALCAKRKWIASLGTPERLAGNGRRYPIRADGVETVMGNILQASEHVAGAYRRPLTEAFAERHPSGVPTDGYLTILGSETLMQGREWDGKGIDPVTGMAKIGRFADGAAAHIKLVTRRYGIRHGLLSGTTGSGKSELLNLLVFLGIVSGIFVPVILDPQEGQSLPFWRERCLYAAGVDDCRKMLNGLHAGMLSRSRYLSNLRWDDDGVPMRGMPFFDHEITGLPMPLIIFDEAHMVLTGNSKGEREIVKKTVEIGRLGRKTGTALWLATQLPSLSDLGNEQALRDMLRGGNVISMRTANRVAGGMLGLQKDPSEIPSFFTNGKETYGLGLTVGPDNRPDAPMRTDVVTKEQKKNAPGVPSLDDRFLEAMDTAMGGASPTATVAPIAPALPHVVPVASAPEPADEEPEGRRCVDAVWQVLSARARSDTPDMEKGDIAAFVNDLATGPWERKSNFSVRIIGEVLKELVEGKHPGRAVTKQGRGIYRAALAGDSPATSQQRGTA